MTLWHKSTELRLTAAGLTAAVAKTLRALEGSGLYRGLDMGG
jgi:hypothetical protein